MEETNKDYFQKFIECKMNAFNTQQKYNQIVVLALRAGEQFYKDHNRHMTHEEKENWLKGQIDVYAIRTY